MRQHAELTQQILACAFDVHARMGPGLLESTYQSCLQHRMAKAGMRVEAEVPIPIAFDEITIPAAYRADLVVDGLVLIELKTVERILPIHIAQTRTYLKHSGLPVALLLNFNVQSLVKGIRRYDSHHRASGPYSFTPSTRS